MRKAFDRDLMEWKAPTMQLSGERDFQMFIHNKMHFKMLSKITNFSSLTLSLKTSFISLRPQYFVRPLRQRLASPWTGRVLLQAKQSLPQGGIWKLPNAEGHKRAIVYPEAKPQTHQTTKVNDGGREGAPTKWSTFRSYSFLFSSNF